MLYDRLVVDLQQAETAIISTDLKVVTDKLCHAQQIVVELHSALDTEWAGAENLGQLYTWLHWNLIEANTNKDLKAIADCMKVIVDLRDAWQEAYSHILAEKAVPAASPTGVAAV